MRTIDNRRRSPDSFMPLWIADYLADTTHLTTEQDGAFLLLLMGYWRRKCVGLPDDDTFLCQLTKMSKHKWRHVRPIIGAFFDINDGVWRNKRADQEWAYAIKLKDAKSAAGRKGAEVTNASRAGRAKYVPPHAGAKSYENSQGVNLAISPQNSEGDVGTQTAELSQSVVGTAEPVLSANGSANAQPTPTPIRTRTEGGDSSDLLRSNPEIQNLVDSLLVRAEPEPHQRPASKPISSKVQRGTRWPADAVVPDEWVAEAAARRKAHGKPMIDLVLEAEKFRNYWSAKSGASATKIDWRATWRNWALNSNGVSANGRGQFGRTGQLTDHPLGIFGQLGDELRDREISGSGWPEDHGGHPH